MRGTSLARCLTTCKTVPAGTRQSHCRNSTSWSVVQFSPIGPNTLVLSRACWTGRHATPVWTNPLTVTKSVGFWERICTGLERCRYLPETLSTVGALTLACPSITERSSAVPITTSWPEACVGSSSEGSDRVTSHSNWMVIAPICPGPPFEMRCTVPGENSRGVEEPLLV